MMDLIPYAWSYTQYKVSEFYKKYYAETVQVNTNLGPVCGLKISSSFGFHYVGFHGIPYAKPPIGNLRFKDPVPADPWTEPYMATNDSSMSVQKDILFNRYVGTEDCLHLNVYTKNISTIIEEKQILKPVMLFLHGGAFIFGSKIKDFYNPEYILRKDVVLVVINYRLGAFGFLSIDDKSYGIPGNAGLKDQVMAMKWVKQNIANFGGDPENVTLFGESAGGCSVHYHMLSNMSRGLFHKAILMSGTVLNSWSTCVMKNLSERLAKAVGWKGEGGTKQMMEVLMAAKPESLIKAQDTLITKDERRNFVLFPFGPIVEPYILSDDSCMIPKDPVLMCREAWSANMPAIFSACSGEGLLFYKITKNKPSFLPYLNEHFETAVPFDVMDSNERNSKLCKEVGSDLKKYYFGYTEPSMANIFAYLQFLGDKLFWHGLHRTLLSRLSYRESAPTYLFRFDFDSPTMNFSKFLFAGKSIEGACHADDCAYIFKNCISGRINESSNEYKTIDNMVEFFTQFATTGNPNSDRTTKIVSWNPIELGKPFKCLNISKELNFIDLPENERLKIWDEIYQKTNANLY